MSDPMLQPMLARRQLRTAAVFYLRKLADITVQSPGNWPTPPEKMPALLVNTPTEQKSSINKGIAEFTTTCSLVVQGRVEASTPEAAQDAIEQLAYRVENALFEGYWLTRLVQQFSNVSTEQDVSSEGKNHLGGFRMTLSAEMYEVFDPTVPAPDGSTWPPDETDAVPLDGIDMHLDTAQPFDATGAYPPGEFDSSVQPAPRTTGPDGRDEGALQIDLPQ